MAQQLGGKASRKSAGGGLRRGLIAGLVFPLLAGTAWAQRPPTDRHVPEMAAYLDRVQIAEPAAYRNLAVYPILVQDGAKLRGRWLTLDRAISRGVLVIMEKGGGGSVPSVIAENRSRDEYVVITSGEIISGGQQTRTVRNDVILAPGQRIELSVFCVEAHRWAGGKDFGSSTVQLPQSIQSELRKGADQGRIWAEVGEKGRALKAENPTASLELMLKHKDVQEKLGDVRRTILPKMPDGTVGYIFVSRGRALGAELFGSEELARDLLPKLLDSYAVDHIILHKPAGDIFPRPDNRTAINFFERVCRAGSQRASTPGSGAGIRTRTDRLLGDGVSLESSLVHYGVQIEDRIGPPPPPKPPIIYPPRQGLE
jgi:hypothetical protein